MTIFLSPPTKEHGFGGGGVKLNMCSTVYFLVYRQLQAIAPTL